MHLFIYKQYSKILGLNLSCIMENKFEIYCNNFRFLI